LARPERWRRAPATRKPNGGHGRTRREEQRAGEERGSGWGRGQHRGEAHLATGFLERRTEPAAMARRSWAAVKVGPEVGGGGSPRWRDEERSRHRDEVEGSRAHVWAKGIGEWLLGGGGAARRSTSEEGSTLGARLARFGKKDGAARSKCGRGQDGWGAAVLIRLAGRSGWRRPARPAGGVHAAGGLWREVGEAPVRMTGRARGHFSFLQRFFELKEIQTLN
jgi:hypothetical protein